LGSGNPQQDVYVAFQHFETNLVHDPEFGFGQGPGTNFWWIIIIIAIVVGVVLIVLVFAIVVVLIRRKRRAHVSL